MFYLLVQLFCLPICLWMIRCCKVSLYAQQLVQLLHETQVVLWTAIMYRLLWHPMYGKNAIMVNAGHAFRRQSGMCQYDA